MWLHCRQARLHWQKSRATSRFTCPSVSSDADGVPMMATVNRLNELLEADRAGVETRSRLFPAAATPGMRKLFEQVRDDEAWSCAGLARSIKTLGGETSEKKGDFADTVMAEPTLPARLRLLNRGQGWVVKRLDALLAEALPRASMIETVRGAGVPAPPELSGWVTRGRSRRLSARP